MDCVTCVWQWCVCGCVHRERSMITQHTDTHAYGTYVCVRMGYFSVTWWHITASVTLMCVCVRVRGNNRNVDPWECLVIIGVHCVCVCVLWKVMHCRHECACGSAHRGNRNPMPANVWTPPTNKIGCCWMQKSSMVPDWHQCAKSNMFISKIWLSNKCILATAIRSEADTKIIV